MNDFIVGNKMELGGEANKAFELFPTLSIDFETRVAEFQRAISDLKSRKLALPCRDERKKINSLRQEIDQLLEKYMGAKEILRSTCENLLLEARTFEAEVATLGKDLADDEAIEYGSTLIQQAINHKNKNDLLSSLVAAYQGKTCLENLLKDTTRSWVAHHENAVACQVAAMKMEMAA